jgi:hypothetical protein
VFFSNGLVSALMVLAPTRLFRGPVADPGARLRGRRAPVAGPAA